jgi:hypothetical protein
MKTFRRADILIPQNCDLEKWSVVACDQFTSQPAYWAELERRCAGVPSALHLMLPEAWLGERDQFAEAEKINGEMRRYLDEGVFRTLPESYVYVERRLANGAVRRGLLGVLDLEDYDYAADSVSPIRATEGTVESRLPPRVRVRSGASLEMPHIMVFIDDERDEIMASLAAEKRALPLLYDFDLCAGGGHIRGWQVCGDAADALDRRLDGLADPERLREKYGAAAPAIFAMGDGNHSLAAAKKCWEELRPTLTPEERETHPARFSLVELVNIHDEAIAFEPIHRVLFETDPAEFLETAALHFADRISPEGGHTIRLLTATGERTLTLSGYTIGTLIADAEDLCQLYLTAHGGRVDYIHNDDTAAQLGTGAGCAALLLPRMEKTELFPSIIRTGPFPKKSFSIGRAEDKRYYLECRKIK